MTDKSLLLVFRHPPYGNGRARAGLDIALATAAFDQPVSLLFMDDGIWQLLPDQDPAAIGAKSTEKALASLPLYDIDSFHVDQHSLDARGLQAAELAGNIEPVPGDQLAAFMSGFDQVLLF